MNVEVAAPGQRCRWTLVSTFIVALLLACSPDDGSVMLRFWAMGREGELVAELARDFEAEHANVVVQVQQIPWSAAHEKLLTGFVGGSSPDAAQLGNTWIAEFAALGAIEALDSRIEASPTVNAASYFSGIWDTNVIDGVTYGIPWYVDTRVLFYRTDLWERAGHATMPRTWDGWRAALEDVQRTIGAGNSAIFLPVNEWTQPAIFGLQAGASFLADHDSRGHFSEPAFRDALRFYLDLFERGLAPPVRNNEIANIYQEFARGRIATLVTGPWNLGEFRRRLPAELQDSWSTAPMPGPSASASQPGASLAGGSSLVLFRGSKHPALVWEFVEFLSRPEQQLRFYALSGDLPARIEAWQDSTFAGDERILAFGQQLRHVRSTPKIPEWEQIATRLQERVELAVRGYVHPDSALALLDDDVDRILEKRRWLLQRRAAANSREQQR